MDEKVKVPGEQGVETRPGPVAGEAVAAAADAGTAPKAASTNAEVPKGLRIFDYVLAGVCFIEGLFKLYMKVAGGRSDSQWSFVLLPFLLGIGLLQHKKSYRIICIILLALSLALPFILAGILS